MHKVNDLEVALKGKTEAIESLQHEIEDAKEVRAQLQSTIEEFDSTKRILNAMQRRLQESSYNEGLHAKQKAELEQKLVKYQELQLSLAEAQKANQASQLKVDSVEENLRCLQSGYEALEVKLRSRDCQIKTLEASISQKDIVLERTQSDLQDQLETLRANLDDLQNDRRDRVLKSQFTKLQKSYELQTVRYVSYNAIDTWGDESEALEQSNKEPEMQQELIAALNLNRELNDRILQLQSEVAQCQAMHTHAMPSGRLQNSSRHANAKGLPQSIIHRRYALKPIKVSKTLHRAYPPFTLSQIDCPSTTETQSTS
ncbi:hypothetical protein EV361DRAFT_950408 [Lentinula raphanica]|nr:hypothetical protein EV361DRAFT_950408 [Lentinula raphanica]